MIFASVVVPAPAVAAVYTGSIEFAPPPPPPPSFQPQPDPTTQAEYFHTATTRYDQASGDVTVTATVFNNAFWSNPYGGGPELFFQDFYLAPACADSLDNVPYGATYISFTYGPGVPSGGPYHGFDSPPGAEPGSLGLDGVEGSLTSQSAFDGTTYSISFHNPRLAGHQWTCSGIKVAGEHQPYVWDSYALHGPPKPPAKPPARASLSSADAAQDFSVQLSSRYGRAWSNSTVPSSNPSPVCPQGIISGGSEGGSADCIAEFAYRGVWHRVSGTVSPRQDKVGDASINDSRKWTRRWRPMSCKGPGSHFPGTASSNDGACYQTLFSQFFSTGGRYRFRFKRHVYVLGTGTGYFPKFYTFNCGWRHKTYQCTNFFGDGFRWRPYA